MVLGRNDSGLTAKGEEKMVQTEKTASVSTVAGKTISELTVGREGGQLEKVTFKYIVQELEKGETIPEGEYPDADEILSLVNAKRNASARSKAQTKALEAENIEVPSQSVKTPEGALANIVRSLMAQNRFATKEEAEVAAKALLGI